VNIKHHWWWKLNFINQFFEFKSLLLLEEDHALVPDAISVLNNMQQLNCEGKPCDIISLGHYRSNLKLTAAVSKSYMTIYIH
jgi:alpha-1,6-mannosyl-glycoprotein beta-1,2-N-acetylglucosaminyltransferase